MSLDTSILEMHPDDATGFGAGRAESLATVFGRQRLGLWVLIGSDAVTLSALLFTYLYLRGVNTDGHWMSLTGYTGHPYSYYYKILDVNGGSLPNPTKITVGVLSKGLNWLVTLITVISAGVMWFGEKTLRTTKNAKAYSTTALVGTLLVVVAIILTIVQMRHVPQIFQAFNDSETMNYTTYDSSMLIIFGSGLIHLAILAFIGLGMTIRSARGVVSGRYWQQANLVRIFWVWIAVSAVILSAVTSTINVIH